jgi:hypothetical protein
MPLIKIILCCSEEKLLTIGSTLYKNSEIYIRVPFFILLFVSRHTFMKVDSHVCEGGISLFFNLYFLKQKKLVLDRGSIPVRDKGFSSILCVQTGSEAHPASCTVGTGVPFTGVKRGRGVTLTTHPHLVPRSRLNRSYTSSPRCGLHGLAGILYLLQSANWWKKRSYISSYI